MIFTTVLDADKQILLIGEDKSLFILLQVNKTIKNIIVKDSVLNRRVVNYRFVDRIEY